MKDFYSAYTNDELWLIKANEWVESLQNIRESQFTLANGYMGTRGILEEIPYDAMPGTYISGIYDKTASQVSELVNLPNPVNFRLAIGGEKVDVMAMDCLEHKRCLNLKKALLVRRTLYRDRRKRCYDYQSLRFICLQNKNIGVLQIAFTALDDDCSVDINTGIDTSVFNSGVLSEGRKRHFLVRQLGQRSNAGYLIIDTLEKKFTIACWSGFYYEINGKKVFARDNTFSLKLKKNQPVVFTKVFCIKHFPYQQEHALCREEAFKIFHKAFHSGFDALLEDHIKAWEKLWKRADIVIKEAANLQQNLRFNIYHMLSCSHYDSGFSSIGARTLSGEGYRGHIFWDTEIFLMPFYLFNLPKTARNMLLYRYKRLQKARELAKKEGFRGAKFPWESADAGDEETPEWARDLDRTIIKIYTHKMEHHITADISYAVYKYYVVTGDEKFMRDYGYEMMFEAARFWASRVTYNKRIKKYEINHAIGPDEFHTDVNNNAYTNMMAKWNLLTAEKLFNKARKEKAFYKKLRGRLNLSEKEAKNWKRISSSIKLSVAKNKVIEQFDGYFKLREVAVTQTDENGMPLLPRRLKVSGLGRTQLVKQADVLMLIDLLDDVFAAKTKAINYEHYIPRTLHQSSLSPSIHSKIACEAGDLNRAYNLFNVALRTDIGNLFGNTHEGIHAAALGGTWQAVVFGFAGVRVRKEVLHINPRIPRTWKKMIFSLQWRGSLVRLELASDTIKMRIVSAHKKSIKIGIFDKAVYLAPNKEHVFKRKVRGPFREQYYY